LLRRRQPSRGARESRTIVAIKLDQSDNSWLNGQPYTLAASVFDEYDLEDWSLDPTEFFHIDRPQPNEEL
jgi:hypothetical protein